MASENLFGLGFIEQEPVRYGAQIVSETKVERNKLKVISRLAVAATFAIATMTPVTAGARAATDYLVRVEGTSLSASVILSTQAPDRDKRLWDTYTEGLKASGSFSAEHVDYVKAFFLRIRSTIDEGFPLPHAGPTPEGALQLVWDRGEHHVDVDIHPTGTFEWFYSNRATNAMDGQEDCEPGSFSAELVQAFRYLVEKSDGKRETARA